MTTLDTPIDTAVTVPLHHVQCITELLPDNPWGSQTRGETALRLGPAGILLAAPDDLRAALRKLAAPIPKPHRADRDRPALTLGGDEGGDKWWTDSYVLVRQHSTDAPGTDVWCRGDTAPVEALLPARNAKMFMARTNMETVTLDTESVGEAREAFIAATPKMDGEATETLHALQRVSGWLEGKFPEVGRLLAAAETRRNIGLRCSALTGDRQPHLYLHLETVEDTPETVVVNPGYLFRWTNPEALLDGDVTWWACSERPSQRPVLVKRGDETLGLVMPVRQDWNMPTTEKLAALTLEWLVARTETMPATARRKIADTDKLTASLVEARNLLAREGQ